MPKDKEEYGFDKVSTKATNEAFELPEGWVRGKLVSARKEEMQFGPVILLTFEITRPKEYKGEPVRSKPLNLGRKGIVSPASRTYAIYAGMRGVAELEEGDKISFAKFADKEFAIFIDSVTKGESTYYNVTKVKRLKKKGDEEKEEEETTEDDDDDDTDDDDDDEDDDDDDTDNEDDDDDDEDDDDEDDNEDDTEDEAEELFDIDEEKEKEDKSEKKTKKRKVKKEKKTTKKKTTKKKKAKKRKKKR